MRIKIIGRRQPWIEGKPRAAGYETNVDASVGNLLIERGMAEEVVTRARNDDGTLKADDPATPENEAWEGGEAPKKRSRKKVSK